MRLLGQVAFVINRSGPQKLRHTGKCAERRSDNAPRSFARVAIGITYAPQHPSGGSKGDVAKFRGRS